jgi:EmrB/QacA subfamily drug resistance transporter
MTDTIAPPAPGQVAPKQARPGVLLAIVLIGQFMALLDVAVVNVAGPSIRSDLHSSGAGLQLVIAGYTIAYAVLLITGARLGDRFGHGRMFLTGLVMFTLFSLACGLAGNTGELIGFRVAQGVGAAVMVPQVLSVIQRTHTGNARMKALSRYSAVMAGGAVVGQVLGGALVSANIWGTDWRPVFLINVPIGAVLLYFGLKLMPRDKGERSRELDFPGLITLAAGVLLLVVPLVLGNDEGWPLWGWICLAASVLMFGLFAVVERGAKSPLMPPRVLRAQGMMIAVGAIFAAMIGYGGYLFSLALHLQSGLGFSPLRAGLTFIPIALSFATASLNWRRVPARFHRIMVPIGLTLAAGSLGLMALAVHNGSNPNALFWISEVIYGLGIGSAFSPLLTMALSRVNPSDAADASGILTTTVQLGQVIGVAGFGTLYLSLVAHSSSGHSIAMTSLWEGLAVLVAAFMALLLSRRPRAAATG